MRLFALWMQGQCSYVRKLFPTFYLNPHSIYKRFLITHNNLFLPIGIKDLRSGLLTGNTMDG